MKKKKNQRTVVEILPKRIQVLYRCIKRCSDSPVTAGTFKPQDDTLDPLGWLQFKGREADMLVRLETHQDPVLLH